MFKTKQKMYVQYLIAMLVAVVATFQVAVGGGGNGQPKGTKAIIVAETASRGGGTG